MDALPFFQWLDTSFLASISKAYGGVFAVVQVGHLLSMILLGGMVLVSDLRLLGIVMRDIPSEVVIENTNQWMGRALAAIIITGIFMSSAVAMKLYYNEFFWSKMTALLAGILFFYLIKKPLLSYQHATLNPWTIRLTAVASLLIWFAVAASGRWIGFS